MCPESKTYQIQGRLSADIIKKAGYKISALDIEGVLLEHDKIREVIVFGVDNDKYGEEIVAMFVSEHEENDKN